MDFSDKIEVARMTRISKALALRYGPMEFAEDFSQYALEILFTGRKATFKQLLVDYVRAEMTDSRAAKPHNIPGKLMDSLENAPTPSAYDISEMDFNTMIEGFEGRERAALVLYYKWSFTMQEIGHTLGLTESRISQILTSINSKLNLRYGNS